ncbi:MAG: PilZ domain-containing protein [Terriglobales bacterium]|jgi:hypothetical protein
MKNRRHNRTKAVLPVKVTGKDVMGNSYQDWAHTLDITPGGARLGTIHRQFALGDSVTVQYRQRKADFRVVWTKLLKTQGEYQIGLEMLTQERDPWGLEYGAAPAPGTNPAN